MQIGPAINLTQVLTGSLPGISVSSQTFDAFPHIYENSCKPGSLSRKDAAGDITPEAVRAWEMDCLQFFRQKEVASKDQVGKVAWNLQDPRVQDWYSNECDRLNALTFAEFTKEVRSYWLSSNWTDIVQQKVLSSTQGDKAFHVWAAEVQNQNVLLRGELSHLPEEQLRLHLESHMYPDVLAEYCIAQISEEKDFRKWIEKVRTLDEKRLKDIARQKVAVEEAVRASRMFQPSRSANAKTSKAARARRRVLVPPPLTADERKLLRDNAGCYKCRQFFQNHFSATCTNDFPDPKGYKTLTSADVEAARTKKRAKPIAAVLEDELVAKHARTSIEEIVKPVAVVMPSAVLGDGSESDGECVAPISSHAF